MTSKTEKVEMERLTELYKLFVKAKNRGGYLVDLLKNAFRLKSYKAIDFQTGLKGAKLSPKKFTSQEGKEFIVDSMITASEINHLIWEQYNFEDLRVFMQFFVMGYDTKASDSFSGISKKIKANNLIQKIIKSSLNKAEKIYQIANLLEVQIPGISFDKKMQKYCVNKYKLLGSFSDWIVNEYFNDNSDIKYVFLQIFNTTDKEDALNEIIYRNFRLGFFCRLAEESFFNETDL